MEQLLTRGIDQVFGREDLTTALASSRKLRIKFGVDPTRPDIHLGHAVVLQKLRAFQDLGHTVIFLIGDYTTKIGDPSGRNTTRPVLTDAEIEANAQTYLDQVGLILDVSKAEVRRNSEWLGKLSFNELIQLASQLSVAQLIEREDFDQRLKSGQELALHELLYPLMQAYDSVALKADVEFGGTDQLFNLLMGRSLQKKLGQKSQAVITVPLLVGTDGHKKMSKSLDNYIGITDEPVDMYGRVMSIPDNLIAPYYDLCTTIETGVIQELVKAIASGANPRDSKASLARELVRLYHGETPALAAEGAWEAQFREGGRPETITEYNVTAKQLNLEDILTSSGVVSSKGEVRRLISQGGIKLDEVVVMPHEPIIAASELNAQKLEIKDGSLIQVGKRRYLRIRVES